MSFSTDIKTEILENKPLRTRYKKAQAYGLFAFSKSFSASSVSIATENPETAKLFKWFAQDFLGRGVPIAENTKTQNGRVVHTVKLVETRDRERLLRTFAGKAESLDSINMELLTTDEQIHAFLSGAYLACGNITDPGKSYHIEFIVRNEKLCDGLAALLDSCLPGVKRTTRRSSYVAYYKEYAQIEDLLTIMGASKACLAMIEIEMIKSVRNSANRVTNCETANIDKLVDAAAAQIEDIRLVLDRLGEENLPQALLETARLRLDNPDSSLRELAGLSESGLSRSGIHHRLSRLSRLAEEIRREEEKS